MTKQEIEKAIENGEDVWVIVKNHTTILPYKANLLIIEGVNDNGYIGNKVSYKATDLFKTQAEAEHYICHANIIRLEKLPFLTWEEFLEKQEIRFIDNIGEKWHLYCNDEFIYLQSMYGYHGEKTRNPQNLGELTEANFYRVYDECVRLFKGE